MSETSYTTTPAFLAKVEAVRAAQARAAAKRLAAAPVTPTPDADQRRAICQACPNGNDIGAMTGHCRAKGSRASCPSCRVTFSTGKDSQCPAGYWAAGRVPRAPYRFAYFTGSNRPDEGPRMAAMIRSARLAGVSEDFHAFGVSNVAGAINHRIPSSRPWKNHMTKVDLLLDLSKLAPQYDAYVWLDSDNWFVRDPGNMTSLLRDNPIWVGLEAPLAESVHGDWYGMPTKGSPNLVEIVIAGGCNPACVRGTNGGMWVVRRGAVPEFHARMFEASDYFARAGYPNATNDEPALSIVGSTMAKDSELNTADHFSGVWACDWVGRFQGGLPDGQPWLYKDWGTQQEVGLINPAIVHNMRGKHLMTSNSPAPALSQ